MPNFGGGGGGGAQQRAGVLAFLRDNQQFQGLRHVVQANPQILQPMLQELGKQNPQLLQLINANQVGFDGVRTWGVGCAGQPPVAFLLQLAQPRHRSSSSRPPSPGCRQRAISRPHDLVPAACRWRRS